MHENSTNRPRRFAAMLAGLAAAACLGACNASASVGGPGHVPKADVEREISTSLAAQVNQPAPLVSCPGDLKAEVGATMQCDLSTATDPTHYPVHVRVSSVEGLDVNFDIEVGATPLPTASS